MTLLPEWPVRRETAFGCVVWTGAVDKDGYGRYRGKLVHRVAWELEHGAILDGLEVEHRCRVRTCLRHLELLTRSEQERAKSWRRRVKAECRNGCDMELYAMTLPTGGRLCRRCDR